MKVIPVQITVDRHDTFFSIIEKIHRDMSEFRPYRDVALANSPGARVYDVWLNYLTAIYPPFCGIPGCEETGFTPATDEPRSR
jgi:hypothetical protein